MPRVPNDVPWTSQWRLMLIVAAIAIAASVAGVANDFANDDAQLILQNSRVHRLTDLDAIVAASYWPPPASADLYRPLTTLLLALQWSVAGDSAALFRIVSYCLYAVSSISVFVLASRLLPERIAFGAALVFAAHPVHVEAVALAVAQAELIVGILAVAMTLRYLQQRRRGRPTSAEWVQFGVLYACACLIKEQGFVIPGLMLAAEVFLLSDRLARPWRALAFGYAGLAVVAILMLSVRHAVLGEYTGTFVAPALLNADVGGRTLTMLRVVPEWLRLFAWPYNLQIDYSPQELVASTSLGLRELLGALILVLVLGGLFVARRKIPVLAFGLAWCAVAILPVSNVLLPTGILLAERTLFLPSVGVVLAIAGLAGALRTTWLGSEVARRRLGEALALFVVFGIARSARRHLDWRNEWSLSARSAQDAPLSYRTQQAFANTLFETGRFEEGTLVYERATSLAPVSERWWVFNNFALSLQRQGKVQEQVPLLLASLGLRPTQPEARGRLITTYLKLGLYREALAQADTAVVLHKTAGIFVQLKQLADSALTLRLPPGSVDVGVVVEPRGRRP